MLKALTSLSSEDQAGDMGVHRDTLKTLLTVVSNLISKPLDPGVRRLNKNNASV